MMEWALLAIAAIVAVNLVLLARAIIEELRFRRRR